MTKPLLALCVALTFSVSAHGQGEFLFDTLDSAHGNDLRFVDVAGNPVSGPDFFVEVLAGPTTEALMPMPPVLALNRTGAAAGYTSPFSRFYTVPFTGLTVVGYRAFQGSSWSTATAKWPLTIATQMLGPTGPTAIFLTADPMSQPPEVLLGRGVCALVPLSRPTISSGPQGQAALVGEVVTLEASVAGVFRFQWSRDGVAIPGATSNPLVLTNVQPKDAGSYTVMVQNDAGTVTSSPAALSVTPIVLQAPLLTAQTEEFGFEVSGLAGRRYVVETTSGLAVWDPILTTNATGRTFRVVDSLSHEATARCYRVRVEP